MTTSPRKSAFKIRGMTQKMKFIGGGKVSNKVVGNVSSYCQGYIYIFLFDPKNMAK